ncbi:MAG: hypothetical protein K8S15_10535 [Candidatus Aegiribacteria sp.]|nr:hypothetical protein [Candidatus Aegiribacteria sp.]
MKAMNAKELVVIGCFGAVGAALEISLGTLLHTFKFVPFKGLLMTSLLVVILVASRILTGRRSAPFMVGAVIATLKMLSPGAVYFTVTIAILLEGFTVFAVLSAGSVEKPFLPVLAGICAAFYSLAHKFLINGILMGSEIFEIYLKLLRDASLILGMKPSDALWLLVPVFFLHVAFGSAAGYFGWKLGNYLRRVTRYEKS